MASQCELTKDTAEAPEALFKGGGVCGHQQQGFAISPACLGCVRTGTRKWHYFSKVEASCSARI